MDDREILDCIAGLVAEEHWLRQQRDLGLMTEDREHTRLEQVEQSLDDLWADLRQRRALRAAGMDADAARDLQVLGQAPEDAAAITVEQERDGALAEVVPLHAAAGRARLA